MTKTSAKKPQSVKKEVTKAIKKPAAKPAKVAAVIKQKKVSTPFSKAVLAAILANLPFEWRGTTFKNSALLGREKFASKLHALIAKKGVKITESDLTKLGNAEDYLRVSSNVSSVLECYLASKVAKDISRVFTFSSKTMAIVSVMLSAGRPVRLYIGNGETPFTANQLANLALIGCSLTIHSGSAVADANATVLTTLDAFSSKAADAVVKDNVLYINNA